MKALLICLLMFYFVADRKSSVSNTVEPKVIKVCSDFNMKTQHCRKWE